jgi:IS5 family transposase
LHAYLFLSQSPDYCTLQEYSLYLEEDKTKSVSFTNINVAKFTGIGDQTKYTVVIKHNNKLVHEYYFLPS